MGTAIESSSLALVFPGQGAQRAGMGRDFHEAFDVSRRVFAEASEALGFDVAALCFDEDPRLEQTEFTQPAILTMEIAVTRALASEFGVRAGYYGGHSLGEYTALCAAGVMPLGVAVTLVRQRGALMQRAVPRGVGAMVAVSAPGIARDEVTREVLAAGAEVANRNSLDQVVLSGAADAVERACRSLEGLLAGTEYRLTPLTVSAPFHCSLMRTIEPEFEAILRAASGSFVPERASVVTSNFTGAFHEPSTNAIIDALTRQISGSVNWIENMQVLARVAERIYEVGPNRPLRGFFKTVGRDVPAILSAKNAEREFHK